jgi:hypothetical protein
MMRYKTPDTAHHGGGGGTPGYYYRRMGGYNLNKKEVQMAPSWRGYMKYPNLIPFADPRVVEILDTLEGLVAIEEGRDRVMTILLWLARARDLGLILSKDEFLIKRELIDGCGGF